MRKRLSRNELFKIVNYLNENWELFKTEKFARHALLEKIGAAAETDAVCLPGDFRGLGCELPGWRLDVLVCLEHLDHGTAVRCNSQHANSWFQGSHRARSPSG